MDTRAFVELVSNLIEEKNFERAEDLLLEARSKATAQGDAQGLKLVLSELVELYCLIEPPRLDQAESFAHERELLSSDAYTKLQTAMMLYYAVHDYNRTVPKLREAIDLGRVQNDQRTVYSSLSLLGQALLKLGHTQEALTVLSEIEEMVSGKKSFVVGDETSFLESIRARGLEADRVTRIATALIPLCRDPEFKRRLTALSVAGR